jgi:hypothetical protein
MTLSKRPLNFVLMSLLAINVVVTLIHYSDSAIHLASYPGPTWFSPTGVMAIWVVMTLLSPIGYWLYVQQKFITAYLCLGVYALTGLTSPGHYLYEGAQSMTIKMTALIWSDAIAGVLIVGFLFWSGLFQREWQQNYSMGGSIKPINKHPG